MNLFKFIKKLFTVFLIFVLVFTSPISFANSSSLRIPPISKITPFLKGNLLLYGSYILYKKYGKRIDDFFLDGDDVVVVVQKKDDPDCGQYSIFDHVGDSAEEVMYKYWCGRGTISQCNREFVSAERQSKNYVVGTMRDKTSGSLVKTGISFKVCEEDKKERVPLDELAKKLIELAQSGDKEAQDILDKIDDDDDSSDDECKLNPNLDKCKKTGGDDGDDGGSGASDDLTCDSTKFHKKVCDFIEWTYDTYDTTHDKIKAYFEEEDIGKDNLKDLVKEEEVIMRNSDFDLADSCPAPKYVNTSFLDKSVSIQVFNFEGVCKWASFIEYALQTTSLIIAFNIVAGRREL